MSTEELLRLSGPAARRGLVRGELIVRDPAGFRHGDLAARLLIAAWPWLALRINGPVPRRAGHGVDTVAIDAGCLGFWGTPQEQARVRHVLLSHTHMDHLASLPIFVENAYEGKAECVTGYASRNVL